MRGTSKSTHIIYLETLAEGRMAPNFILDTEERRVRLAPKVDPCHAGSGSCVARARSDLDEYSGMWACSSMSAMSGV